MYKKRKQTDKQQNKSKTKMKERKNLEHILGHVGYLTWASNSELDSTL